MALNKRKTLVLSEQKSGYLTRQVTEYAHPRDQNEGALKDGADGIYRVVWPTPIEVALNKAADTLGIGQHAMALQAAFWNAIADMAGDTSMPPSIYDDRALEEWRNAQQAMASDLEELHEYRKLLKQSRQKGE